MWTGGYPQLYRDGRIYIKHLEQQQWKEKKTNLCNKCVIMYGDRSCLSAAQWWDSVVHMFRQMCDLCVDMYVDEAALSPESTDWAQLHFVDNL